MSTERFIREFQDIGLSEREARLYLALLGKEESSAAELHRISGVIRSKTYELLENLVTKGFATERIEGRKKYFRPVPPDDLKQIVARDIDAEHERKKDVTNTLFTSLHAEFSSNNHNGNLDKVEVLRNNKQIHLRYLQFMRETKEELLSFSRSPYARANDSEGKVQEDVAETLLKKGVVFKGIYMLEDDTKDWLMPSMERYAEMGEEARFIDYLPIKLFISDQKRVLFSIENYTQEENSDFTMLVIKDEAYTTAMNAVFESYWAKAREAGEWRDNQTP